MDDHLSCQQGATGTSEVLFSFGVIADVQYADLEDGYDYLETRRRYYRHSLLHLQSAIEDWNGEDIPPQFVLQLGDIIDGFNAQHKTSKKALARVMKKFKKLKAPVHHIWGNHELYNFSRNYLRQSVLNSKFLQDQTLLSNSARDQSTTEEVSAEFYYAYHFCPKATFRFILLDTYDLSILGRDLSTKKYQDSLLLLRKNNPNENLNSPVGLAEHQFVQFNGGFSQDQLDWLDSVLAHADKHQERVVIAGHIPIHPRSSNCVCLAWNYKDALAVIHSHPSVVCFLAGHLHDGGYCLDSHGVHHVTLEGIIESPPETNAFGTVYVYDDRMVLKGRGRVPDLMMPYRKDSNATHCSNATDAMHCNNATDSTVLE